MLNRVTNLASSQLLMSHVTDTRARVDDLQAQLASGQAHATYASLGSDAERLLGLEAQRDVLSRFVENNDVLDRQYAVEENTLESFRTIADDLRFSLIEFAKTERDDESDIRLLQEQAFKALETVEALLSTENEGKYLYSGSQVRTAPVDLGLTTLADFQAQFDGNAVTYPTTREAHLFNIALDHADTGDLTFDQATGTIAAASAGVFSRIEEGTVITVAGTAGNNQRFTVTGNTGTVLTVKTEMLSVSEAALAATLTGPDDVVLDAVATGGLTIDAAAGTITAAETGSLEDLLPGTVVTLDGAPSASNNTSYTVLENDGTTLTIAEHVVTDETPAPATSTITVASYYQGDDVDSEHRADAQRTLTVDLNAMDPVFEKVIRALGILAQGDYGSEGGLDQNPERVEAALYLVNSAMERAVDGTPPYGTEAVGNLEDLTMEVGLSRSLLAESNERLENHIGLLETEIGNTESADSTEVSVLLLDQINTLETSLATIARVRQLSLADYL